MAFVGPPHRSRKKGTFLSRSQVRLLIHRVQTGGDREALDQLVRSHTALVAKVAREFRWSRHDLEDLMQVGHTGLLRAIEKFDLRRPGTLSTYAVHWIRAMVRRFVVENWRLVRVGTTRSQRAAFQRARCLGTEATPADRLLRRHLTAPEVSLDGTAGQSETAFIARLPAPEATRPDVQIENREARARFRAAVAQFAASLSGRDRFLFQERWLREERQTLAQVGARLGVSRERTRQIEERLLTRLGRYLSERVGDVATLAPALASAA